MYGFYRVLVRAFMHLIFRIQLTGLENVPQTGGVIVCLNHRSLWDVPFIACLLPRRLRFMAKKELFSIPLLSPFMRWTGAFPVTRGSADIGAIKTALGILKEGHAMTMFPEGKRVLPGEAPVRPKSGVGMLAVKSGCPVLPIGIGGRYRLFAKKTVNIGKPMVFSDTYGDNTQAFGQISAQIMAEILRLAGETEC